MDSIITVPMQPEIAQMLADALEVPRWEIELYAWPGPDDLNKMIVMLKAFADFIGSDQTRIFASKLPNITPRDLIEFDRAMPGAAVLCVNSMRQVISERSERLRVLRAYAHQGMPHIVARLRRANRAGDLDRAIDIIAHPYQGEFDYLFNVLSNNRYARWILEHNESVSVSAGGLNEALENGDGIVTQIAQSLNFPTMLNAETLADFTRQYIDYRRMRDMLYKFQYSGLPLNMRFALHVEGIEFGPGPYNTRAILPDFYDAFKKTFLIEALASLYQD